MFKRTVLAILSAMALLPAAAFAQSGGQPGISEKVAVCNYAFANRCIAVNPDGSINTNAAAGGSSNVNLYQVGGAATQTGHGTAAGALRVELPTDGTGVVGLNAGSQIIGKFDIDQTMPGTTNGVQVNAPLPAGTNLLGKVGIDETNPGTTNLVYSAESGTWTVAATQSGPWLDGVKGLDGATITLPANPFPTALYYGTTGTPLFAAAWNNDTASVGNSSSLALVVQSWTKIYNGATGSRQYEIDANPGTGVGAAAYAIAPTSVAGNTPSTSSACTVACASLITTGAHNLYGLTFESSTAGFLQLFDATTCPSGTVSPKRAYSAVTTGLTYAVSWGAIPLHFTTGIALCFSSATTPFTSTPSTTAYITLDAQ